MSQNRRKDSPRRRNHSQTVHVIDELRLRQSSIHREKIQTQWSWFHINADYEWKRWSAFEYTLKASPAPEPRSERSTINSRRLISICCSRRLGSLVKIIGSAAHSIHRSDRKESLNISRPWRTMRDTEPKYETKFYCSKSTTFLTWFSQLDWMISTSHILWTRTFLIEITNTIIHNAHIITFVETKSKDDGKRQERTINLDKSTILWFMWSKCAKKRLIQK